ncbi:MAG: hypothetical protein Q8J86_07315 [Desulfurivibrionaceae bacterium]|nr:hypothetical protein [Desulfurivibrionaceae bacterium]
MQLFVFSGVLSHPLHEHPQPVLLPPSWRRMRRPIKNTQAAMIKKMMMFCHMASLLGLVLVQPANPSARPP